MFGWKDLADYAAGRITPEMAVGHSLQHITQLYESQATTRVAIDRRLNSLQAAVDRLLAFMDKVVRAQQKRADTKRPKPGQAPTDK